MPAQLLALAFLLLPSMAMADSQSPWFGSAAVAGFQLVEVAGRNAQSSLQLRISADYRCSAGTCQNPGDFANANPNKVASPQ